MKYPQLVSMPSAVSDWLEEQLEARGIDSEVYTRYILSLLHAHTLDFIYPDDDVPFLGLKKERRSVVTHKRLRRTGNWWRYANADAEQIKRSAAVECLMSATEQNCEVESLVDELCAKLKEVNSTGENFPNKTNQDTKILKKSIKKRKTSSKELAEEYYAAFPPLNQKEEDSDSSNINLIVGKWPSPDKNPIDLIGTKLPTAGSPKKTKRKPKRHLPEATRKSTTSRMAQNKMKFGQKRTHSRIDLAREMSADVPNWQFAYNNNSHHLGCDHFPYSVTAVAMALPEDVCMCEYNEKDCPICRIRVWMKDVDSEKVDTPSEPEDTVKRTRDNEKDVKYIPLYSTTVWSDNEDAPNDEWGRPGIPRRSIPEIGMQTPWFLEEEEEDDEEETAIPEEYQRYVNKEVVCAIKEEYDRPHDLRCHKPVPFDHWDGGYNKMHDHNRPMSVQLLASVHRNSSDVFNSRLNHPEDEQAAQNRTTNLLEDVQRLIATMSTDYNTLYDEKLKSLMQINHSMDNSAFREYSRPLQVNVDGLMSNPFLRQFIKPDKRTDTDKSSDLLLAIALQFPTTEEQRRISPMYFKPIKASSVPERSRVNAVLTDGTTFNIRGSPDEVKYQRTGTGSLLLETEFGERKKYFEYNWRPSSDESVKLPKTCEGSKYGGFKVKYRISPNDKSCQTGEPPLLSTGEDIETGVDPLEKQSAVSTSETQGAEKEAFEEYEAYPAIFEASTGKGEVKIDTPEKLDSTCETDELAWGYSPKDSDVFCKDCKVKLSLLKNTMKTLDDIDWGETQRIWGKPEGCDKCPSIQVWTRSTETTIQLREECKEEAEKLLSDLSNLQLSNYINLQEVPITTNATSVKGRRHSYISNDTNIWSFATRLEEDCLINLSTLPTRRSVTL